MLAPATPALCPHCNQPLPRALPEAPPPPPATSEVRARLEAEDRRDAEDLAAIEAAFEGPVAGALSPRRWPCPRQGMTIPRFVRQRMAEDFGELLRQAGQVGTIQRVDLRRLGWTAAQVEAHAEAALALATETTEGAR